MPVIPSKKRPLQLACSHCLTVNTTWVINTSGQHLSFRWLRRFCTHCSKPLPLKTYDHLRRDGYKFPSEVSEIE